MEFGVVYKNALLNRTAAPNETADDEAKEKYGGYKNSDIGCGKIPLKKGPGVLLAKSGEVGQSLMTLLDDADPEVRIFAAGTLQGLAAYNTQN